MATIPFKKQDIKPFKRDARPAMLAHWTDRAGARQTASLGTKDLTAAKGICLDLERLCNAPALWELSPDDKTIAGLSPKARQIFFGLPTPPSDEFWSHISKNDVNRKGSLGASKNHPGTVFVRNNDAKKERELRVETDRKLNALEKQKEEWKKERSELHKQLNMHCAETIGVAVEKYAGHYAKTHETHTAGQVARCCREFASKAGNKTSLGKIEGKQISDYIDALKLGLGSKRKYRAYLSAFFSWAVIDYKLSRNPIMHAHKVKAKPLTEAEKEKKERGILAIRNLGELKALLAALKPYPYWRAWIAFAALAGPRWSEQARLKAENLSASLATARIYGRKTDNLRETPIEQTILRPILKEYLEKHRPEVGSNLLFPSLVAEGGHGARDAKWRLTTWRKHLNGGWNPAIKNGKLVAKGTRFKGVLQHIRKAGSPECFGFGPDEWRHSAATAMGQAGISSLRISQWIGNSEAVCRKHYIAKVDAELWPLKFKGGLE